MTTESKQVSTAARAGTRAGTLIGAVWAASAVGAGVALAGLVADGPTAAYAAVAGAATTALVLGLGAAFVDLVARMMPAASLLASLLTYLLQLLVLSVALFAVARRASDTETGWSVAGVVAVALAWTLGYLVLAVRQRIPVYDVEIPSALDGVTPPSGAGAR